MLYAFYIHGPDFFIQNYNPLAMPNNYGKLFPSKDCNGYFTLALTERHELDTREDPCQESLDYSFSACVSRTVSQKVGCGLEGGVGTGQRKCDSMDHYR